MVQLAEYCTVADICGIMCDFWMLGALALSLCLSCSTSEAAESPQRCPNNLWKVHFNESFAEGEVILQFSLAYQKEGTKYGLILVCEQLVVSGSGKQTVIMEKGSENLVEYRVSLPDPDTFDEFVKQDGWIDHACVLEVALATTDSDYLLGGDWTCHMVIKTYMGRILPNCNQERGAALIEKVEVMKEEGEVVLYFRNSPNDVFTMDSTCDEGNLLGHDQEKSLEENMFPLSPPGKEQNIVAMDFYPDCENETIRKLYMRQRMSECHLEVYSVCQEGMVEVKRMTVDLDDESMFCQLPKPVYILVLEELCLQFRVDSKPVAALLCVLIANGVLYILLIPIVTVKVVRSVNQCLRRTSVNLRCWWHGLRASDGQSSETEPLLTDDHAQISEPDSYTQEQHLHKGHPMPSGHTKEVVVEVHEGEIDTAKSAHKVTKVPAPPPSPPQPRMRVPSAPPPPPLQQSNVPPAPPPLQQSTCSILQGPPLKQPTVPSAPPPPPVPHPGVPPAPPPPPVQQPVVPRAPPPPPVHFSGPPLQPPGVPPAPPMQQSNIPPGPPVKQSVVPRAPPPPPVQQPAVPPAPPPPPVQHPGVPLAPPPPPPLQLPKAPPAPLPPPVQHPGVPLAPPPPKAPPVPPPPLQLPKAPLAPPPPPVQHPGVPLAPPPPKAPPVPPPPHRIPKPPPTSPPSPSLPIPPPLPLPPARTPAKPAPSTQPSTPPPPKHTRRKTSRR